MQVVTRLSALLMVAIAGIATASPVCKTDTTQTDFQAGVASGLDLTTSSGNVLLAKNSGSGTLDQQNTSLTGNGEVFSNTQWNTQTFTAGASGALTRVDLNLFCYLCGIVPPAITVSIRATSNGLPTGADLAVASTTMDASGAPKFYTANFASPTTVTAGTQYAIVIRASAAYTDGTLAFTDSAVSGSTGNDVYHGGALGFSTNSGSTWSVQTYGTSPTSDGGFKTYIGSGASGYLSAGDLVSSTKDSAPPTGNTTNWNTISFTDAVPTGTSIKFQAAASNNSSGPFTFVGPDGTSGSYFTTTGADLSRFNGNRYLKYHAFLGTTSSASTPTLNDVTVCYTSVAPSADLSITNSDGVTTATAGNSVTYAITAANAGPNAVTGATVADTFPAGLTCNWTCSGAGGGTCPASGSGNINSSVNLPVSASVTFAATCSISSSASGTLTNTATVAAPAGVTDPVGTNNSASDSDTIAAPGNVAITMTDNVDLVRIGDVVNYTIELTNVNGPSNPSVTVTDSLPAQLNNGTWVCSASGGAGCGSASGSGNLSDKPTLPPGGKVDYIYTAHVVSADANGQVSNTASAKVMVGGNQSTTNPTASDADVVVIFAASFEGGAGTAAVKLTGGGAAMTVDLGVDGGLLNHTSVTPVTIASGHSSDGRTLFSVQLVRLAGGFAMRTLTTIDDSAFSTVSPWTAVDLKQHRLTLSWQSASAAGDDGFLRVGTLPPAANNARAPLSELRIAVDNSIPWLVPIAP